MSLKQKLQLAEGMVFFGIVLGLLGAYADSGVAVCLLGLGVLLAGTFLLFRWKRCPECGDFLGRDNADYCPHCGKKIDYDAKKTNS